MKAIILAAGSGWRLREVTAGKPKCLLEIGGRSLLSRSLEHLRSLGVQRTVVVVGFAQQEIRRTLADDPYPGELTFVENENYHLGNMVSLWAARAEMDDDLILMDADVLFCAEVLERLVFSPWPTAVLMDETIQQKDEECMVTGSGGRVRSLNKAPPAGAVDKGETVGFIKVGRNDIPALLASLRSQVESGRMHLEYEDALAGFIRNVHLGYEKIGGLPWIEIDFPEDLERAMKVVLPLIDAMDRVPATGEFRLSG